MCRVLCNVHVCGAVLHMHTLAPNGFTLYPSSTHNALRKKTLPTDHTPDEEEEEAEQQAPAKPSSKKKKEKKDMNSLFVALGEGGEEPAAGEGNQAGSRTPT